jgi:transcriptional regulator with XRE-family HTH domain
MTMPTVALPSKAMPETVTESFFGDRVKHRLRQLGKGQTWLGQEVGILLEREPFSQSIISMYLLGQAQPDPETVFAMERVLGVRPGAFSRYLGYLPLDLAKLPAGVEQTILADDRLSDSSKRALIAAYREMKD